MERVKTLLLLWIFVLMVATASSAQQNLTLSDAKRIAFRQNWDLLAARSDVDLATAQRIVAREFPNPSFTWSSTSISVDSHPNNIDTVYAVSQLFEIGGKRGLRKTSAEAGLKSAEARFYDARRLLDQAVTKSYIDVLSAQSSTDVLRESANLLRREAEIADTRFQAGDISKADEIQIEITADRLELDAETAEANASKSKISLQILLGMKNIGDIKLLDSLDTLAGVSLKADLSQSSEIRRPDLIAAEEDLRKTDADYRFQRALRISDPTVLGQYERVPPDQPNTIGIGLSVPLPLWNRNGGAIRSADVARNQARIQLEKVKAQIASDIATAQVSYKEALARWKKYQTEIQPQSEDVRKTVAFAYEKGGASLVDLLTAERNDNEIRLATAQAMADSAAAAADLQASQNVQMNPE